ncbi:hypothetical protein [Cryptosporangium minutisporangium]|uniref:Uncharacterized protein n=1 Tax=Cryptosporangium minutisporangium TaxID=113569 RepID=A0ABP6T3R5_9ACTN
MSKLRARTPDEAYLFVELVAGGEEPVDLYRLTEMVLDDNRPVLRVKGRHAGRHHDFEITMPPVSQKAALRGELYGCGHTPSTLIDAGQWRAVELWACSIIEQLLEQSGGRGLDPTALGAVAAHVDAAYSALAEIDKFLPEGDAEIPDDAFWTADGIAIRGSQPGAFRRERLVADEANYRSMGEELATLQAQVGHDAGHSAAYVIGHDAEPPVATPGGSTSTATYSSLPQK